MRGQEDAMANIALKRLVLKHPASKHRIVSDPSKGTAMLSWRRWGVVCVLLLLALLATSVQAMGVQAAGAPPTSAQDDDSITYTMKKGDTLIGLANRHFIKATDYKQVQRLNAIRDPNAIATGKIIRIPRAVLKYRAIAITVASARGPVTVNTEAARAAMPVVEGATVRTGAQGFATLAFDNGSRTSLPSNSALIIRRARTYQIDGSRDVELELVNGGIRSKVQPMTTSGDRNRVRTRHSVTAVRGTEFGTSADDMGVTSEVYEGRVALAAPGAAPAVDARPVNTGPVNQGPVNTGLVGAGFGVKLSADGARTEAALLPPPVLVNPGKIQSGESLAFQIDGNGAGISGYRVELATDASFIEQIADERSAAPAIALSAPEDGRYYLRLSAIDANGFVGMPVTYAFRRIRSGATASAAVDANGYVFKWQVFGARRPDVRFRLYRGDMGGVPMIDEPAIVGGELRLSDLPPGTYVWRIGTRLIDDGDVIENWNAPETLIVSP
jgi:hypothetical protein